MAITTRADGEYVQVCVHVASVRLARKRAKHLREEAEAAEKDAQLAEQEGEAGDASEFLALAAEARGAALAILLEARKPHGPCVTCGGRGEVTGNGTYGGPAKHPRVLVGVL